MKKLQEAYTNWSKDPTTPNMMHALQAAQPVIDMAVRSYVGNNDPVTISRARLLTLKALRSYDPKRGTQLRTHLLTQLQPLKRLAAQRRFVAHVPEQVQYDMTGLRDAEANLTEELGREPSDAEISDRTGLSMLRIRKIRKMAMPMPESVFGQEGPPESEEANPMNDWQDYVYHDLGPVDQKIFEWRTGYNGRPQLGVSEISKKLGLSAGRVTQRANMISGKLEEGLKVGGLVG